MEEIYEKIEDGRVTIQRVNHNLGKKAMMGQESDGVFVGDHGLKTRNERSRLLIEYGQINKLYIMNN